jgi:hypothetical protein
VNTSEGLLYELAIWIASLDLEDDEHGYGPERDAFLARVDEHLDRMADEGRTWKQ